MLRRADADRLAGRSASNLKPGDQLLTDDGGWVEVTKAELTDEVVPVYNLHVEGLHTYFVTTEDGKHAVLVHNRSWWQLYTHEFKKLWVDDTGKALKRADQAAGQALNYALAPEAGIIDKEVAGIFTKSEGENLAVTFGTDVKDSFVDGRAADSVTGGLVEMADSGADLVVAAANSGARAEFAVLNAITGQHKEWEDIERPGRLSDHDGPLYGHEEELQNGRVVGHYTVRVQATVAAVYGGVGTLQAAGGLGTGIVGTTGAGTGQLGFVIYLTAQEAGAIASVGAAGGMVVAGVGANEVGALDPLANWYFAKAPKVTKKLPRDKLIYKPKERGRAPIGEDGKPVELHHTKQDMGNASPRVEMTREAHRGKGNYTTNHTNTGQKPSKVDRAESSAQHKEHWKQEWDAGEFDNLPEQP